MYRVAVQNRRGVVPERGVRAQQSPGGNEEEDCSHVWSPGELTVRLRGLLRFYVAGTCAFSLIGATYRLGECRVSRHGVWGGQAAVKVFT